MTTHSFLPRARTYTINAYRQTCRFVGRVRRLKTAPDQAPVGPEVDRHNISARLDDVIRCLASAENAERRRTRHSSVVYLNIHPQAGIKITEKCQCNFCGLIPVEWYGSFKLNLVI